jgi:hypothetical protein
MNELIQFDTDTIRRRHLLDLKFADERQSFDNSWERRKPQRYRKESPGLRDLVVTERSLAVAWFFSEAKQLQREVDS